MNRVPFLRCQQDVCDPDSECDCPHEDITSLKRRAPEKGTLRNAYGLPCGYDPSLSRIACGTPPLLTMKEVVLYCTKFFDTYR